MFWMDWKLNSLSEINWYPAMRIVRIYIIILTDDSWLAFMHHQVLRFSQYVLWVFFLHFSFFVCTKTHMFIQHLNKWSKGLYALDLNGGTRCICKVQKYSVLLFVRMEIPLASLTKTQQQLLVCLHQNMFYPWALMRLNVSLQFNAMNSARESRKKADDGKKIGIHSKEN